MSETVEPHGTPGLLHRSLNEVLNVFASPHDMLGGGGPAAALTAATAAALTAKIARESRTTWIEAGGAVARAETLRIQAQALIDRDAEAYRQASLLLGSDGTGHGSVVAPAAAVIAPQERERRVGEALIYAADLALAIADAASEIAWLAADVARECPPGLRPDALTAVALAEAVAASAARLVEVNRLLQPGDPRVTTAGEVAQSAAQARDHACGVRSA